MSSTNNVTYADDLAELRHLLSLAGIEMLILQETVSKLDRHLGMLPEMDFALRYLPGKRGQTVVTDVGKLSANLTRIGELIPKLLAAQSKPAQEPAPQQSINVAPVVERDDSSVAKPAD
jgi:hypothetical protein